MKKNAYFQLLIVGFLGFSCIAGQSPRKEVEEITTVEDSKEEFKREAPVVRKEVVRKSAAKRAMEDTGHTTLIPKGAAKKVVEAEEEAYSSGV